MSKVVITLPTALKVKAEKRAKREGLTLPEVFVRILRAYAEEQIDLVVVVKK